MNTMIRQPMQNPALAPSTPIPPPVAQGFRSVYVVKDDANIDRSAREVGGRFNDREFRNRIGWNAHII